VSRAQVDLVKEARALLERADPSTAGLWPRATALLARQAIERALAELWRVRAPGVEKCSARAQLLCLPIYLVDDPLAERVSFAWSALSRGCHQHPYELPPTAAELTALLHIAEDFIAKVAAITAAKAT
jgi:hypothetical protein